MLIGIKSFIHIRNNYLIALLIILILILKLFLCLIIIFKILFIHT